LCIKIIGEKDTANVKSFLASAKSWRLIQLNNNVREQVKQIDIPFYKARLACIAVQSRNDTLPIANNSNNVRDKDAIIDNLENEIKNWKLGSIIGGVLILALIGIGLWLFKKEKQARKGHNSSEVK